MTGPTERFPDPEAQTARLPVGPTVPDQPTAPIAVARPAEPVRRGGFWRELSGALAAGLCALAVVVMAMQVFAGTKGMPGPGVGVVLGHMAAAVAAVVFQRFVDRGNGPRVIGSFFLVLAVTAATIWFFWLA
ncbi:hypothetical protein [Actinokineospora sp. HUAS TT18]|uniref:hypothetical protein n=1 Tax=Actinokineospora sp. HUAS TT18 TaxID=3447451 RepID=UPI003F528728